MYRPITGDFVREILPVRPENAHKGVFGKLMLIVGSEYYPGAACMATAAALRSGVGIATVASARTVTAGCIGRLTEATYLPLPETPDGVIASSAVSVLRKRIAGYQAIVLGCGLTCEPDAERLVSDLLILPELRGKTVVLDADGINCAARHIHLLSRCHASLVLTPHRMELARLCGCDLSEADASAAERLSRQYGVTVVAKSEATAVFRRDGQSFRLENAMNPGLAKGGSGDVLAGIIGSLCAQGLAPDDAACAGVWLHSQAGLEAARRRGVTAMLPGDMPDCLSEVFMTLGR